MTNDPKLIPLVILPAALANTLKETANQTMGLWDYLANGGIITVAIILWIALRR
jgi:hypothetical protein